MKGPLPALVAFLLAAAMAANGEEPRRLGGGFGRPTATPRPTFTPTPRPAATPTPTSPPLATRPAPVASTATPRPVAGASLPVTTAPPTPAASRTGAASAGTPPPAARTAAPQRTAAPRSAATPPRAAADVSVGYVLVPFVVTDTKGRPVAGLRQKDVTLLSDGVPVAYDLFEWSVDAPVSFAILLDGSGSMALAGKMEGARAALEALAATRVAGDDFALFVFADGELTEVVPFTEDPSKVVEAARRVKPWGKTAFRDALARMPEKSLRGKNGSRAVVLLSDGIDNDSRIGEEELRRLMEGVDVPVFPLGIRSPGAFERPPPGRTLEWMLDVDVLRQVAAMTGGRMAIVDDPALLPERILDIQRDLRSQYLIGFAPTGRGPVRFRSLALRVAGPARPVRVRAGFRGTDPPALGTNRPGTK